MHIRHTEICGKVMTELALSKLIIVPSFNPPHKNILESGFSARKEMLEAAFAFDSRTEISDAENNGKKNNYACDVVSRIAAENPGAELFYIIGGDSLEEFSGWRNPEVIASLATIVAVARPGYSDAPRLADGIAERFGAKVVVSGISARELSSTYARALISLKIDASKYLPQGVPEIIARRGLYRGFDKYLSFVRGVSGDGLFGHAKRTVLCAVRGGARIGLDYEEAFLSALLHDSAKEIKFIIRTENGGELPAFRSGVSQSEGACGGGSKEKGSVTALKADTLKLSGNYADNASGEMTESDSEFYEKLKNAEYYAPSDALGTPVLHQFTGAETAAKVLGITDGNIIDAIACHTTAKPNMTPLDKLVYLADKIEDERDYAGADELRRQFFGGDLDGAFKECLKINYEYVSGKKRGMYYLTQDAYEYYFGEIL